MVFFLNRAASVDEFPVFEDEKESHASQPKISAQSRLPHQSRKLCQCTVLVRLEYCNIWEIGHSSFPFGHVNEIFYDWMINMPVLHARRKGIFDFFDAISAIYRERELRVRAEKVIEYVFR